MSEKIKFYKYQGTGNDFILVDNRKEIFPIKDTELVKTMCDRRFGIGADGLMLLENSDNLDFRMRYYNSDGRESSMCGNGGRCISAFAADLKIVSQNALFEAVDGVHSSELLDLKNESHFVKLNMNDVIGFEKDTDAYFLNTGSPHYVVFVKGLADLNVFEEGRKIRYNTKYKQEGVNVNFVEKKDGYIFVRTYERGVENETYSCGTGVTAAAIAFVLEEAVSTEQQTIAIKTLGGDLNVKFSRNGDMFTQVWLEGPAAKVFEGEYEV